MSHVFGEHVNNNEHSSGNNNYSTNQPFRGRGRFNSRYQGYRGYSNRGRGQYSNNNMRNVDQGNYLGSKFCLVISNPLPH